MTPTLRTTSTGIEVTVGGRTIELSWRWLRDHATDASSFDQRTRQRLVRPSEIARSGAGTARVDDVTGSLRVDWSDGATTDLAPHDLNRLGDAGAAVCVAAAPEPWAGDELSARRLTTTLDELRSDDGLRTALHHLWRDGVIVLNDVPLDHGSTRAALERFGYIRSTIFGSLWEFSSDGAFDDTASTPLEITPHTDGTYSNDAPGLLGLHCHRYEAAGGENVFVDGLTIAALLSRRAHDLLASTEIPARYIGDGAHLMAKRPPLRYDGDELVQVSYNHHDRAPFTIGEPATSDVLDALYEFDALANRTDLQFEIGLRSGDMVIFDNWRLLHGRRAFTGERLIAGGYVNREDVESTTRRIESGSQ